MVVSVEQTVATLRARASAQRLLLEARAKVVRDRLDQSLSAHLAPGTRAWLIGSLAWGGFGDHSDVDLVLGDVDSSFASQLELLLTRELDVPVEVLRLEDLPATFRDRIEREGLRCHGS